MQITVKNKSLRYKGRRIAPGDSVDVYASDARVLIAVGLASEYVPLAPAKPVKAEPVKVEFNPAEKDQAQKRQYVRRDLSAKD